MSAAGNAGLATGAAPLSLRLALATWPRHDRRHSGGVVLGVALDMIDAGSSAPREAAGLVRTGLGLRVAHLGRAFAGGPWRRAVPLAITAIAAVTLVLIATDAGGWRQLIAGRPPFPSRGASFPRELLTFHGTQLAALGCIAAAACALLGRRVLTVGFLVATALTAAGVRQMQGAGLEYRNISFGYPAKYRGQVDAWSYTHQTGIDLAAGIGFLAGVGALIGGFWALSSLLRRWNGDPRPATARPTRAGARALAAGVLVVAAAPTLIRLATDQLHAAVSPASRMLEVTPSSQIAPVVGIWLVTLVAALVAAITPRRAPAVALAALVTVAAAWVPFSWTSAPLMLPVKLSDTSIVLATWGGGSLLFLAFAAAVIRTAGRTELRRGDDGNDDTPRAAASGSGALA